MEDLLIVFLIKVFFLFIFFLCFFSSFKMFRVSKICFKEINIEINNLKFFKLIIKKECIKLNLTVKTFTLLQKMYF